MALLTLIYYSKIYRKAGIYLITGLSLVAPGTRPGVCKFFIIKVTRRRCNRTLRGSSANHRNRRCSASGGPFRASRAVTSQRIPGGTRNKRPRPDSTPGFRSNYFPTRNVYGGGLRSSRAFQIFAISSYFLDGLSCKLFGRKLTVLI